MKRLPEDEIELTILAFSYVIATELQSVLKNQRGKEKVDWVLQKLAHLPEMTLKPDG